MKKVFTYSAIVLLLGLTACNKTDNAPLGSENIRFVPASVETRALIENADDLQSQTFKVYDDMGTTPYYIDNTIVYDDEAEGWTYGDASTYGWVDGTHKFFGYTDGAGTFENKILSVGKILTTAPANQVDLLYSDIYTTTAANWKANKTAKDAVMLNFHHLFSAVSFMVTNTTSNQVVLNSVDVKIPNKGSATVNYAGDDEVVEYGNVTTDGDFITASPFSGAIAQDQLVDVLTQAVVTKTLYQMVWPQEFEEDGDLVVSVSYTMTIPATEEGEDPISSTFNSNVKIPAIEWEAGNRYVYTLQITPSDIQLLFKVMPWDEGEAGSIDTKDDSINMSNVTWMNTNVKYAGKDTTTVVNKAYLVNMFYKPVVNGATYEDNNGYFPATGYFTVNYPESGLFKLDVIPAYGESTVQKNAYKIEIWDPEAGEDGLGAFVAINPAGETITKETVYFRVVATAVDSAAHKAQIDIWFKPTNSTEWISAYSEIRATYTLAIPAR